MSDFSIKHIAVDQDDVILDFFGGVVAAFEREYGVKVDWDGQPWGEKAVAFTTHPLFLASGYKNWWGWLRDRHWLWATFPAVPGAIGGLQQLRAAGYYVELLTSKPEWAEPNVWKWLGRWRPPLNRVTIVRNGQRKLEFTDAQVIIDDKWETCAEFAAAGRWGIYFSRFSTGCEMLLTPRTPIARNWTDVLNIVRFIEQEESRGRV